MPQKKVNKNIALIPLRTCVNDERSKARGVFGGTCPFYALKVAETGPNEGDIAMQITCTKKRRILKYDENYFVPIPDWCPYLEVKE